MTDEYECLIASLARYGRVVAFVCLGLAVGMGLIWRLVEWWYERPSQIEPTGDYVPFWLRWFRRE